MTQKLKSYAKTVLFCLYEQNKPLIDPKHLTVNQNKPHLYALKSKLDIHWIHKL